jgi:hypothetical protein
MEGPVGDTSRTSEDPGYVDLMSPAGIGIGAVVYNYDGHVYASDERLPGENRRLLSKPLPLYYVTTETARSNLAVVSATPANIISKE